MPRRREKRDDTSNSDSFEETHPKEKIAYFGTVRLNRALAPDQIDGDDSSKYSILAWSNTLQAQRMLPWPQRKQLFRRALSCLPYSYKVWHMYLTQFVDFCSQRSLQCREWSQLNERFDQALNRLPKMPRIWLMYAQTLEKQQLLSKTRQVYNWSFRNLPLTQHQKIWKKFVAWAMKLDNHLTATTIIPRYMKINPDFKETYVEYLLEKQLFNKAAEVILAILADEGYSSKAQKEKKDFYFDLVALLTEHPDRITCVDGPSFIKEALSLYPDEAGRTWVRLSDYYIRLGEFELARKVLEQAIEAIENAKDFGVIFSAYVKFEEEMITALASQEIRTQYDVVEEDNVDFQIQTRLNRLKGLLDRQPFLLLKIAIKKSPNQVQNWLTLARLHQQGGNLQQAYEVVQRAVQTVNPEAAEGKLSDIWIYYSQLLQKGGEIRRCNQVLHEASQINFRMMEDFLSIWRRWVELLLEERFYEDALRVIKHVLFRKRQDLETKAKNMDDALRGHATLWQLYIDLEVNFGNFETIRTAFERCRQHRSLTPLMLLNYTNFLWQSTYFEETFRVFEFALSNFKWPSLHEIWLSYIHKFVTRHGGTAAGVERARSMFERLFRDIPQDHALVFYFIYAEFEEQHGLYSHAVEIYDRMVRAVPAQQKFQAYSIYIAKVAKLLGVTKARPVFQDAIQSLPERQVLVIGRKYAELESNLGEIDRARAILSHISQFTDPRDDSTGLWGEWEKFQVEYGDKDSYKEYLRIKRSVEAKYSMLPPDLQKIEEEVKKGLL